eukprot:11838904-Alexandrium_andersonii.AAC.1
MILLSATGFTETVFADDLGAVRALELECADAGAFEQIRSCQDRLHAWGAAVQVSFDHGKESAHIIAHIL